MELKLTNSDKVTIIDDELFNFFSAHCTRWYLSNSGYAYGTSRIYHKTVPLHSLPFDNIKGYQIDHINRDKLDNRVDNLRQVTRGENNLNRPKISKKTSSLYKGVCWNKQTVKWMAYHCRGTRDKNFFKNLGNYDTELEAAEAVKAYLQTIYTTESFSLAFKH